MSIPDPVVLLDARARYVHPAFEMSRASTKTVFDAAGRLVTVPPNAIGWGHDPTTGQSRGYLAEPSATNLLLHSNDLTQSDWVATRASITPDAITGPDGNGMGKIIPNTDDGLHHVSQNAAHSAAGEVSVSCLCAPDEYGGLWIEIARGGTNTRVHYDLQGEGLAQDAGGVAPVDYGIKKMGVFYYVWLVFHSDDSSNICRIGPLSGGARSFAGDGTSGLYLGYCQAEPGSYPTSYIETGGATATRADDWLRISRADSIPSWHSKAGFFLFELHIPAVRLSGDYLRIVDEVRIARRSADGAIIVAGSLLDTIGGASLLLPDDQPGRHKIAFAWDVDDGWVCAVDGQIARQGNMNGAVSGDAPVNLLNNRVGSDAPADYGSRIICLPQRPSNADLQSLTAIQE